VLFLKACWLWCGVTVRFQSALCQIQIISFMGNLRQS